MTTSDALRPAATRAEHAAPATGRGDLPTRDLGGVRSVLGHPWVVAVAVGLAGWAVSRAVVTGIAMITLQLERGAALGGQSFVELLARWDSPHFRAIIDTGYFPATGADPTLPAFFPGYPLLSRGVAELLEPLGVGAAVPRAMALIAALGAVTAGVFLWRIAVDAVGTRGAITAVAAFFLGPYALFLHASYSESTFTAFAFAAWWCATRDRWLAAAVLCGLAGTVRPNGLFLLAALVVLAVTRSRGASASIVWRRLLTLVIGGLGTAGYFVYLWVHTGRIDEWTHAQQLGWSRTTQWPWQALARTVSLATGPTGTQAQPEFVLDIVFAVLIGIALVVLLVRRRWAEAVLVGLTVLSLTTSLSFVSLARNTVALFPLLLLLGWLRTKGPVGEALSLVTLLLGVALLGFNTHQFALGWWAD